MHVGIVGGGLSGLVTAKTFLEEGFRVTVFETEDEVGGVWARSRRYPGLATQNPRDTYAFSDFPMPRAYPDWPSGAQVQAYLAAYADRFGVTPNLRLRARVDRAEPAPDGWTVRATRLDDGATETHAFDWLVVCNGVFSEPFVPDLPGRDDFAAGGGRVLHSTEFHAEAEVTGKRVVVVGYAKSACDAAAAAAPVAESVTLAYRRALWKMPKRFFGFVHLKYVLTTRFSESLFRYRTLRGFERVAHTVGRPFVWLFWRGIERVLRATHGLDAAGLVPEEPIEKVVACSLSLASGGIYEHIRAGRVRPVKGEVSRLRDGAVELATGERIEADVVVFGTGFRQSVPFLAEEARDRIVDEEGVFHLYRNILHPDVARLGFIGYNSSLYSQLTSEIGARWLARHAAGRLRLPDRESMLREFAERWAWTKTARGTSGTASGACIVPFNFHYLDGLLGDLGARTWRTRNRLKEFMMPVEPSLYADLKAELDAERRLPPREPARGREAIASAAGPER